jgi:peptidyl-prolyl cis-trans isomerase A (cyclophilin A)
MSTLIVLLGFLLQNPAPAAPLQPAPGNPLVIVDTSAGPITIELFKDQAPVSVENFLQYAREGFYEGTIWHRVVPGYVIQGGGYTASLAEKSTRPPIRNEATNGLSNARGTVAMARTSDPNSATAQFFINVKDNDFLNAAQSRDGNGYAVFGKVISGMDVVDKIRVAATGPGDFPNDPVVIKQATVEK